MGLHAPLHVERKYAEPQDPGDLPVAGALKEARESVGQPVPRACRVCSDLPAWPDWLERKAGEAPKALRAPKVPEDSVA